MYSDSLALLMIAVFLLWWLIYSGMASTQALIVFLFAEIAASAGFVVNDFDHQAIHWGRIQVFLLCALPPIFALLLLSLRRTRALGIACAAGIGTGGFLVLALPVGIMILFLGLYYGDARFDVEVLIGYCLTLLGTAVVGWRAHYRLPPETRRGDAGRLSLIVAVVYAVVAGGLASSAMRRPYNKTALISDYNDRQARTTLARVAECAQVRAAIHPNRGYPVNLEALMATGCPPRKLVRHGPSTVDAEGYHFHYFADLPDRQGKVHRFAACARPVAKDLGTLTLGIDLEGRTRELQVQDSSPAASCFAVWAGEDDRRYLQALAACLLSTTPERPGRGYPPDFSPHSFYYLFGACDFHVLGSAAQGRRKLTDRGIVDYQPEPEVEGMIDGYRLLFLSKDGGSLEMDHLGQVRENVLPGVAPTLEALEAARPFEAMKEERLATRRQALAAACEAGDIKICEDLGDFEWDNDRREEAERWWERACEQGRLTNCLLSSRYNPSGDSFRDFKESCRTGEVRSCRRLEEEAALLRPKIEALRARGGYPFGCRGCTSFRSNIIIP